MSNKKDLKAFVRFDGSGRVVAGSLILRRNKPRVGKWQQIQAYECCNPMTHITFTICFNDLGGGTFNMYIVANKPVDTNVVLDLQMGDDLTNDYSTSVTMLVGTSTIASAPLTFDVGAVSIEAAQIISVLPITSLTQTYELPGTFAGECVVV